MWPVIFVTNNCTKMTGFTHFEGQLLAVKESELAKMAVWAEQGAAGYSPWISAKFTPPQFQAADFDYESWLIERMRVKGQSEVVVLPVYGMVSRQTTWMNSIGGQDMARLLARCAADDTVKGVVLDVFSGGGQVLGMLATAQAVQKFAKPIVAHTAFACSAAYTIISGADEIIMDDDPSSEVGSLGVFYLDANVSKKNEKEGVEMRVFRSEQSPDKFKPNPYEPMDDATAAELQKGVNESYGHMIAQVRMGRGTRLKDEKALTGKSFSTKNAIRMGLADGKGSLETAIKRVIQLSK